METSQVSNAPTTVRSPAIATASGNTFVCLVRFALANIRRRPERFVLSVLGIALAIACVTVVRTISASFAITGADSVTDVLGGAQLWAVPAAGVHYDSNAQALVADGSAPNHHRPRRLDGDPRPVRSHRDQRQHRVAAGERPNRKWPSYFGFGGGQPARRAPRRSGRRRRAEPRRDVAGGAQSVTVATPLAQSIVGDNGWWMIFAPPGDEKRRDLGQTFGGAVGLVSTSDPSVIPDPNGGGLIYDTVGGSGPLTFEQKFSALFSGKVTSSTLGLISTIGLGLGFVIAVSSFLAAVQERRREFGIMSSIGLADEVLYFFLVESGIVFLTAYVVGVLGAGVAVALVIPGIATPTAWLQASGMVAAFLPAMAIVGALIPVHRLLQQRPVSLLGDR